VGKPNLNFFSILALALFTNSSPKAFLSIPSDVLLILRHSCCLMPGSFIPILHSGPFHRFFLDVHPFGVVGAISSLPCLRNLCSLRRVTFARWVIFIPVATNCFRDPKFPHVRSIDLLRYSGRLLPRSFIPILPSWDIRSLFLSVHTLRVPRSTLSMIHLFVTMFLLCHATLAGAILVLVLSTAPSF
jgi:hypothetical protein